MELSLATPGAELDPVCGMSVDPDTARGAFTYKDRTFHFCSSSCLKKFQADPDKYLNGHQEQMPAAAPQTPSDARYVCPMHPEVVSDRPGACPKCGMALELAAPARDEGADAEDADMSRRFWVGLALGLPLFAIAMLDMLPATALAGLLSMRESLIVQWALCTPIVGWCGWPIFSRAWTSARHRHVNMFTLIALGVGTAYLFSAVTAIDALARLGVFSDGHGMVETYFESAAAIIVLVLVGQVLEVRARRKTGDAIRSLLQLAPRTARLILPDGREQDVPAELVQKGDRVRVRPGERLPVDGIVREGATQIDESMLTGEPIPVAKSAGDPVSAGTLNGNGTIVVETRRGGNDTLLAQIVQLVGEAQRSRMPVQALVDRVAEWFVPGVIAASALTFLLWAIFGSAQHGLLNALAVLIIACPCALGLATPMAVVVGMGRGASSGVLFRDAQMLERLGQVDAFIFDKTGTLTEGKPVVTNVEPADGMPADELLRLAAGLERGSEHPLAAAIVRAGEAKSLPPASAVDVRIEPGRGLAGRVDGHAVLIGATDYLQANSVEGEASRRRLEDLREEGHTVVQVAVDGRYAGLIAVRDPIRPTTPAAIAAFKAEGLRLVMLTGDSRTTANAVARQIGVPEVISEVLPTQKHEQVHKLKAEGRVVAMTGDGINDAPALALADVGIAMGSGADVAIASAGVTLIRSDLSALVAARRLSQATTRTIRQNLFLAFVYNVLAIPVAAGALVPLGGTTLGPVWAAAAMSLSSLSVVGNSLRLRKAKL
jgi:P-type Cu+ transporter